MSSGRAVHAEALRRRLETARAPLILDGATGTELERSGWPCAPPLWSAQTLIQAPHEVEQIHAAYAAAGAEILTANTFRTQERNLARGGYPGLARELTTRAVACCRRAAAGHRRGTSALWIAGSMAPLEDCYRPDLVPDDATLRREHGEHARHLAAAGCDLLLLETLNTGREARIACDEALATGLPVWVSLTCRRAAALLSGESLAEVLCDLAALRPDAVGVNCLSLAAARDALPVLASSGVAFGVYPNLAYDTPRPDAPYRTGSRPFVCPPARFAEEARGWWEAGARFVGGCCGTGPDHIAALAALWRR
jgi:S-methylmethionine-dependent homocysteine/selenocysteine methylase